MTGDHENPRLFDEIFQPKVGAGDERRVAGSDHFVENEDFRSDGGGDGKGEAYHHARRIGADRHVQIIAELGEIRDVVERILDLPGAEAEHLAAHPDILQAGRVLIHAELEIEQRNDVTARAYLALS